MEVPAALYTWQLDTTQAIKLRDSGGVYYKSPIVQMVGFKWHLVFQPNYKNEDRAQLWLYIHKLPRGVSSVTVDYDLALQETDTVHSASEKRFVSEHNAKGWRKNTLPSEAIATLTVFTFKIQLQLIAVHDTDEKDIVDEYTFGANGERKAQVAPALVDENVRALELRMHSLMTQLNKLSRVVENVNEAQKASSRKMQQQLDHLTVSINKLLCESSGPNRTQNADS